MQYYLAKEDSIEIVRTENLERKFELHNHPGHYVISQVTTGNVEVQINGAYREYKAGEWFVVFPLEPHWVDIKQDSQFVSLCLGKEMIEHDKQSEQINCLKAYLKEVANQHFLTREEVRCFIEALEDIYTKDKEKALWEPDNRVCELAEKIIAFSEESLNLNKMAENCCFSKYHFLRTFKHQVGLTPHQFQLQSRIRKAQYLLRMGVSILDTSLRMGFYDQSHFNKYFLKIVGISPGEYIDSEKCMDKLT